MNFTIVATDARCSVSVDLSNPAHFFACCGLFELAARAWRDPRGAFVAESSSVGNLSSLLSLLSADEIALDPPPLQLGPTMRTNASGACDPHDLSALVHAVRGRGPRLTITRGNVIGKLAKTRQKQLVAIVLDAIASAGVSPDQVNTSITDSDAGDAVRVMERRELSAPLSIHHAGLRLDWWNDPSTAPFKTWAGSQDPLAIIRAMVGTFAVRPELHHRDLLAYRCVVRTHDGPRTDTIVDDIEDEGGDKREPFYFDPFRGACSDSRDIGFSPNKHKMESSAAPAAEALAFIGLQRFRPAVGKAGIRFRAWHTYLPIGAAAVAVSTPMAGVPASTFEFTPSFRTKYAKAFTMARPLGGT